MEADRLVPVSPRHAVRLAREYLGLIDRAPKQDFVVRTITRREANGLPLMSAEIVIAGSGTRDAHALAATYPLHFRKTYFAARLHGDLAVEFDSHLAASRITGLPPPIGFGEDVFRSCLVPGRPYDRLSPFGLTPEEANMRAAQKLPLGLAAGLWRLTEEALAQLLALHGAGLAHGDAELHNFIVCPSPLEVVVIDFESAVRQERLDASAWGARCDADLAPLLREAVFLQCALGRQEGPLADRCLHQMDRLLRAPDRFRSAIEEQADLSE